MVTADGARVAAWQVGFGDLAARIMFITWRPPVLELIVERDSLYFLSVNHIILLMRGVTKIVEFGAGAGGGCILCGFMV